MEDLIKKRTAARRFFTIAENELTTAFDKKDLDIHSLYKYYEEKAEGLFDIDVRIKDLLFQVEDDDEKIFSCLEAAEEYRRRYLKVRSQYTEFVDSQRQISEAKVLKDTAENCNDYKSFKLPKLELHKFDGQPINWISFWGQFRRIHEDSRIDDFDKFRYLIQATEPYSKARQFVESFPPNGENYSRVFSELKERFARDDLLVETYIRSILHLIIYKRNETPLNDLYDKLSSYLHALESLGITTDNNAAMLLPMVESAIPIDILKAWERSRNKSERPNLKNLLDYIKAEVESEGRILIAREGFSQDPGSSKQPTACIVASLKKKDEHSMKVACLFCEKAHTSTECSKLGNLTLDEKRQLLKSKKACFICLRVGHGAKTCRFFPKCLLCSHRHFVAMCPRLDEKKTKDEKKDSEANVNAMVCLRKFKTTFLQTVLVKIVYNGKNVVTRALFDSGAQRSYIRQNIAAQLGMSACDTETISHCCLFGGLRTKMNSHNIYEFEVESLDGQFTISIRALSQNNICGHLPRLLDSSLIDKVRRLGIDINDSRADVTEIGLLIGADLSGLFLTGHIVHIEDSLVAINTKLGWTLQDQHSTTNNLNVISCVLDFSVTDLWDLELIGIKDSSVTKSKEMSDKETLQFFRNTVSRDAQGRYEVHLPWKEGFPELLAVDNRKLAVKRLVTTTKRLRSSGNIFRYDKVFEDWLNEGIIEKVDDEGSGDGLYLYHHAVIRVSSLTTPVRPVFDASAKLQGLLLNCSLEKGANLLQLIPRLLIAFRKNAVGVTADIRKAFLQISVAERDRKYLKFLWWDNVRDCDTLVTFRHKRVVFGVTSSPFLLAATINYHLDSISDERRAIAQKLRSSFYVDNCVYSVNTNVESFFWCDSSVVITWIKRDTNWSVFVKNRVQEIRNTTDKSQWYHVSGVNSPADLPSRGCLPEKLLSSVWWSGPRWLYDSSECWPKSVVVSDDENVTEVCMHSVQNRNNECFSNNFLYFSKYSKIVRCIGWILRFFHNCRFRDNVRCSKDLSYVEYVLAEKVLLRLIQSEHYASSSAPVFGLETVMFEDGLIHVKTRLLFSDQADTFKYPILIPGNNLIVQRLIFQQHCLLQHAGVTIVISKLREFYWLTKVRHNVKKVISSCIVCRKLTCKPSQAPMAPLPENRANIGKVFEVVGVDLAGPLYLKDGQKCWVVLFTCAVFRAVHLELTLGISTDCFLMAFRRFISRRGRVRVVYSDNGTNFVGANNLFKDIDWGYMRRQLDLEKIEWRFIVPSAPWWGGFWERLIRCLKDLLRRVLGRAALTYVELETILYDCEATLNNRPLTYIADSDSLSPLTPMLFMHDLPSNAVHDFDKIDSGSLNMRLNYLQNLRRRSRKLLRERFRNEYLGLLVQRKTSSSRDVLKEGDIVLIENEGKRQFWPIGIIIKMIQGVDKVSRAAIVKTRNGNMTRPIQKLYSSELNQPEQYVTRAGRAVKAPERLNLS